MKKIMKTLRNKKGFTLIELMVVIVIIAILAAIALPTFSGMLNDAKDATATAEARNIYTIALLEVNQLEMAGGTADSTLTDTSTPKLDDIINDSGVLLNDWNADGDNKITVAAGAVTVTYKSDSGKLVTVANGTVSVN